MRIEIFVVNPYKDITHMTYEEKNALEALETIKAKIIHEFGGLNETNTEKGYWEDNDSICLDMTKRWIIYAQETKQVCLLGSFRGKDEPYIIETDTFAIIEAFAKQIKAITAQKSQCFGINETLYFV